MKTIILTKAELDSLPKEVQEQVMGVYNAHENDLLDLKDRVSKLKFNSISYRDDLNKVDSLEKTQEPDILFNIWQKTGERQWVNCSGKKCSSFSSKKYTVRIGRKYIKINGYYHNTDRPDRDLKEITISADKLEEIISLLEEAERNTDEVDADQIRKIAINRFKNLVLRDDCRHYRL
jgi:hypothetical protein